MESFLKLYKKIISENTDEISLDYADEINEEYVELSRKEVEDIFNKDLDAQYNNIVINIDGVDITVSYIIQNMYPEFYEKEFNKFCIKNNIQKTGRNYYINADSELLD